MKRSLYILLITFAAVIAAFFITETAMTPLDTSREAGDITLTGEVTCLPHKNQDGPQTMECAIGFMDTDGDYYALRDTSGDQSYLMSIEPGKQIKINGMFTPEQSDIYQQQGVIELRSIEQ